MKVSDGWLERYRSGFCDGRVYDCEEFYPLHSIRGPDFSVVNYSRGGDMPILWNDEERAAERSLLTLVVIVVALAGMAIACYAGLSGTLTHLLAGGLS